MTVGHGLLTRVAHDLVTTVGHDLVSRTGGAGGSGPPSGPAASAVRPGKTRCRPLDVGSHPTSSRAGATQAADPARPRPRRAPGGGGVPHPTTPTGGAPADSREPTLVDAVCHPVRATPAAAVPAATVPAATSPAVPRAEGPHPLAAAPGTMPDRP